VWLNIVYLLPLCLLPFGAGRLGRYDHELAVLRIYDLIVFAVAVMRVAIWLYATSRPHLLRHRPDHRQIRAGLAVTVIPGLIFLFAVLVAPAAPRASLVIYGIMPVLYFNGITVLRGGKWRNKEYADFSQLVHTREAGPGQCGRTEPASSGELVSAGGGGPGS